MRTNPGHNVCETRERGFVRALSEDLRAPTSLENLLSHESFKYFETDEAYCHGICYKQTSSHIEKQLQ